MKYPPDGPTLPIGNVDVSDRNFIRDKENAELWWQQQEKMKAAVLLKQKQIAEERQREEIKAAEFKRQYSPFDGLVHTDDGRKWTLDGQEVTDVELSDHFDDGADIKTR